MFNLIAFNIVTNVYKILFHFRVIASGLSRQSSNPDGHSDRTSVIITGKATNTSKLIKKVGFYFALSHFYIFVAFFGTIQ